MQCPAITDNGKKCTRITKNAFCWQHQNKSNIINRLDIKTSESCIMYDYLEIHKQAIIFAEEWNQEITTNYDNKNYTQPSKISPVYISSLILESFSLWGNNLISINDKYVKEALYLRVKNMVEEKFDEFYDHIDDIYEYIDDQDFIDKLQRIEVSDDPNLDYMQILSNAYNLLRFSDPYVYDTDYCQTKYPKMIPILMELTEQIKI